MDRPLRVEEGIYMIKNAASGRVLEIEDFKPFEYVTAVHVSLIPPPDVISQTHLWLIQRNASKDFEFTVHSLATGYTLNVVFNSDREGAKVGGYPWEPGGGNGIWAFWGTNRGAS